MGQVIDLKSRQPVTAADEEPRRPRPVADQVGTVYECSRCSARDQLFKLFTDGRVACGDCGAQMGNLQVNYKGDKHGPKLRA